MRYAATTTMTMTPGMLLRLTAAVAVFAGAVDAGIARGDDVKATLAGGTLKLKGDAVANTVTLDQAALNQDQIRITGTVTTINGAPDPVVVDGFTGGLQVDLGAGDDVLTLDGLAVAGPVKIKMGADADTLAIPFAEFHRGASIDLGGGDDVLELCGGTVTGALSIKTGAGTGAARNAACGTTAVVAQGSAVVIDGIQVTKGFAVKASKGSEAVTLHDSLLNADVKLTLGGGSDAVAICHDAIGESLLVQMGDGAGATVTAACDDPGVTGDNALEVDSSSVGSNLTAKMGASADSVLLNFNFVGAAVKLDLGQGANQLTLDGTGAQGSLTVKAGKGDDDVRVANAGIGGGASVNAGAGNNTVALTAVDIVKNLAVKTGNGDDAIDVSGATVHGSVKITHGKGTDVVTQ